MAKQFLYIFFLITTYFCSLSMVEARGWTIVGPRALGMGGAHVAVSNDAAASYWNPAAYGFFKSETGGDYGTRKWSAVLDAGVGATIHEGLGEEINKISKFDFNAIDNGQISANKVADFLQLVNELKTFNENKNRAATIFGNGGLRIQAGHWGLNSYVFGEISGKPQLDLVNISPVTSGTTVNIIDQFSTTSNFNNGTPVPAGNYYFDAGTKTNLINTIAAKPGWNTTTATNYVQAVDYGLYQAQQSGVAIPLDITTSVTNVAQMASDTRTGGTLANNDSKLIFKGIAVGEVPLTYGIAINDDFAIGGNIKYMKARVYNTAVKIFDTDFGVAMDEATKDYTESQNFGIDLGLLYRFGDDLRVGMVGRNLNSPQFKMKRLLPGDDDNIKERPQIRTGILYRPLSFITMAADMDITKNETTIGSGYKSQNLGGGIELNIFKILQLRGGAYKNLAQSDIGLVYTAGIGLNLWLINIDIGAAMASKKEKLDNKDIPKEARVELALSMRF